MGMMGGILGRPGDRPSNHEEAVIAGMRTARGQAILECRTAVRRAHLRQQVYLARGDVRSAEIEGEVKDRRLLELWALMNPAQRTDADRRVVAGDYPGAPA